MQLSHTLFARDSPGTLNTNADIDETLFGNDSQLKVFAKSHLSAGSTWDTSADVHAANASVSCLTAGKAHNKTMPTPSDGKAFGCDLDVSVAWCTKSQ